MMRYLRVRPSIIIVLSGNRLTYLKQSSWLDVGLGFFKSRMGIIVTLCCGRTTDKEKNSNVNFEQHEYVTELKKSH